MRKFKRYEPKQNMIIPFNPEEHFSENSFETFLVNTLKKIDIDSFYTDEEARGEMPYNPRALLGIVFYGIVLGIFSSRKMERGCRNDFGFMYVSGFTTPDHATICRFIERFPEQIGEVFTSILYIADSCKYLDYKIIATDGTKINASASANFTGTMEEFEKRIDRLKKKIDEAMQKLNEANTEAEKEKIKKKKEEYKSEMDKISDFLNNVKKN